ncbi:MAG: alginate export family protein [bacterium]
MYKCFLLLLGIALVGELKAQTQELPIKFDGQIRMRSEADGRDFDSDTDLNTFTLLRTRFGARVQPWRNIEVYMQVQDSRAFGRESSTLTNTSNLDLHQAFFVIDSLWHRSIRLKVGRQELVYGNERLIGAVGWSNVGRSFDGIKWTLGKENTLDLFGMIINESNTPVAGAATPLSVAGRENQDNDLFGAYYQYRSNPKYILDVYGFYQSNLNETIPGDNDLNRVTIGGYGKGGFSTNFDFESEIALQFGKRRGQDVSAFMLTGSVGYTFQSAVKPSLRVGLDYLSGMNPGDDNYKAFDTMFATNHKFYGFMDYFVNVPVNTNGLGLRDFMIKAKVPFANKWNFNGHFHNFAAAKGDEKNFGNELDLIVNYKYNAVASFVFGLAFFIPGDLMEARFSFNDDLGFWAYVTLQVGF